MPDPVRYSIRPVDPHAHIFEVSCEVADPDPGGQSFRMPSWIPGSYLIREFARNVVRLSASSDEESVAVCKTAKDTWTCASVPGALLVTYEVYAWDLSVRAAHLDQCRGYFNGPAVFLEVVGHGDRECLVDILPPASGHDREWAVATTLRRAGAAEWSFGRYRAGDYDDLIDHPVEMGPLARVAFSVAGVAHDLAVAGRHDADLERLARDATRVCAEHCSLFAEERDPRPPFDRYLFQVLALGEGYGGLEHRSSASLICSRNDLPRHGEDAVSEGYRSFLGLLSHEYFHAWHVKRIKPAAFVPYDLARECYTRLLWVFEGFTAYYDDLALVRAGVITPASYLELVGRSVTTMLRGSGRLKQSVAESSFDAWIKFYRPDENAPNAVVSYYGKGSLVAMALDLILRSERSTSLDEVMRALWRRHGRSGAGIEEGAVRLLVEDLAGGTLDGFFEQYVDGTGDPPLERLLARFGIRYHLRAAEGLSDKGGTPAAPSKALPVALGVKLGPGPDAQLAVVHDGGAAQQAGLSAGDVLIAIDGLRVRGSTLEDMLRRYAPGDRVRVHAFRRDELLEIGLVFRAPPLDTCWLEIDAHADEQMLARQRAWLHSPD